MGALKSLCRLQLRAARVKLLTLPFAAIACFFSPQARFMPLSAKNASALWWVAFLGWPATSTGPRVLSLAQGVLFVVVSHGFGCFLDMRARAKFLHPQQQLQQQQQQWPAGST